SQRDPRRGWRARDGLRLGRGCARDPRASGAGCAAAADHAALMYIELRTPDERLRGPKAVDAAPVLASVLHAARDATTDLSRLRVVCDWIQYKQNFRDPVGLRLVEPWPLE